MQEPNPLRVVLLGKHGSGKSSLANKILGEEIFSVDHRCGAKSLRSQTHTKLINGRSVTVIDTPGVLEAERAHRGQADRERAERERQCEWLSCLVQCAPGPHALLLVMPVKRYMWQERAVVEHIKTQFGEEMFRFTVVVFTHGDQLPENTDILAFVEQSEGLKELVVACGGRCHVVDNKYWTKERQKGDPQRSNEFQVKEILATVEKLTSENQRYLSNEALEEVERDIQTEQSRIHADSSLSLEESREQAKNSVLDKYIDQASRRPSYVKHAAVVAGVAGVALAAILVLPKVIMCLADNPPLPLPLPVVPIELPTLPDLLPAPEVVQEIAPPVILDLMESILTEPDVLFERYDPFNLFES